MLSLQSGKGESCVVCPSRKRLALHSTVYSLNLRTRARHRLQGVVKALDAQLASQKVNNFNAGRNDTEQPLRTSLAGLILKAVYGR